MTSPRRVGLSVATIVVGSILVFTSGLRAIPLEQIRERVRLAEIYESTYQWEKAREVYESLLGQQDPGLKIRERYHHAVRRCWQVRRHDDPSFRKEVLSLEYGQAMRVYNAVSHTLLDHAVEKKKLDPRKLFRKGLDELEAALNDPKFQRQYLTPDKFGNLAEFRAYLKKVRDNLPTLTRAEAAEQIGQVAMMGELSLGLSATVVALEFACGACYAVDEYTAYLTPNQLRELAQSLSRSEAVGIGVTLTMRDNQIVVHSVAVDSPAVMLINPNERIVSVNKKPVTDVPLFQVTDMLEGPVGSTVELEIMSPMDMKIRIVRIQRTTTVVAVYFGMLPNAVGHLKIASFTDSTVQELDDALAEGMERGMKGLILDLRGNSGGIFKSSIDVANRFLQKGIITSVLYQNPEDNYVHQAKNPNALAVPIVVLVDNDTASAAEVLAGALKENNRAILIGQTTFGKGCTQKVLKLHSATGGVPTGGMKLTVARYFSPKGTPYSGRGVVPHFIIDDRAPASEANGMAGPYLEKALEELNRMMAMSK